MEAELGQKTVAFSTLVSRTAEESFLSLKELVDKSKSSDLSDSEKKIDLLKYIVKTQQRMLRLNVLAKWCKQVPLIQYCQQLASTLSSHDTCFTQTADSLFFMHEGLQQARAPIYDVPSAIEVLLTGSYERLPKCVENVGMQSSLNENQQKPALRKLEILVRTKLLETVLPKEISEVKVLDGTAILRVNGEFQVVVTLGYRGHLHLWRILHVELLVGEKSGAVKLEELRRFALGDDLERRMAAAVEQQSNPFVTLYSVLHEFCVALVMDTVIRQLCSLRGGRWKDAIKFDLTSDGAQGGSASSLQINQDGEYEASGHRTSGVKIVYWLDSDKNSGGSDVGTFPFIKIEPGSNLQIQCVHSTFVIDPITGKEAEFDLDQSSIDVEKLLLKAIRCNRYTRLLEINKELTEKGQFFPDAGDVHLGCDTYGSVMDPKEKDATVVSAKSDGQEVLCVRAYGSAFFILGINIRNGRYRLQSSRTIIPLIALSEAEDTLNQGTLSASEVFANLRTKSILHMFASIGTFLGLEVYENGFPSVKLPQNILTGASFLLMGFPDCGSSYFLLLQLDKGFKFVFQLLETQPQLSETSKTFDVVRCKKIDVDNMLMLEDEMNLSILDLQKVSGFLPMAGNANQASGFLSELTHKELTSVTLPPSSFSSLIDEVFELEKGNSTPAASHVNPNPLNLQSTGPGLSSPKLEESAQMSHINPAVKLPTHYNGSIYSTANVKGLSQSTSVSSFSAVQGSSANKLPVSKSEQDLASLRSPQPFDGSSFKSMDEDRLRFMNDSFLDVPGRSSRLLSATGTSGANVSASRNSSTRLVGDTGIIGSNSLSTAPVCAVTTENENNPKKRKVCDMLNLLPSLRGLPEDGEVSKRRKLLASQPLAYSAVSSNAMRKTERLSYGDLLAEANRGNAPSGVYISALLHVVRHCSLCIKHAMLSSQMEALEIPYFEETGPRSSFLHIWVKIPSLQGDSWPYICLRLGKPGKLCWDVKINDKHFRDLWELQKGNSDTSWGSGVRIANTSDADSHICYDCEGVILSYQSVEADSIKKLVADIRRLYNARMFALGMRKLLGVKTKDKIEESAVSEAKPVTGSKDSTDGPHRLSEQMRKAFRIEAVGLMSVWFSFGSGVLARFVVEWETGKEGCTMHVTPDQLWPHTKFLEDFINGGEVESLLDCIRLTAGPLHALAAATRPARAGQAAITPGVGSVLPTSSRQGTQSSSQGLLPGGISSNMGPTTAGAVSNAVAPTTAAAAGPLGNHASAMLAAAGRGGSGIVPSSLLPIDVSVVLRGPYWIRIIYRKHFAVDMRCFAGDQVWLQPATPPKGGPSAGGSLPCPQFRPFIMEHVAQELNGLEPNFVSGQQTAGVSISNPPASSSGSQLATINGNRVNLSGSQALSRPGGQISALNRAGNSLSAPPNMAAATSLALRRSSVGAVPAHVRGELNTAIIGLGDDGGYGGGWVPLVALKKVLRGILKYLGVLWLFAQLPDLLKEILGSILKENEGALLNLDQEQPALRFFVGGYVFAVSVHRVQLLLQVLSVKRFHHQQQQQQQNATNAPEELTQSEISEICDYFSRRVASEPYDASRVASFITLLTLPISVLREFLKLIAWKKVMSQAQGGDVAPAQKPRIELCLENHAGLNMDGVSVNLSGTKSNIHYDRPHNSVDFALTVVLDPAHIPHVNAAGGAAWLPYCVSVRLRYSFGENPNVSFLGMDGSHGGRACWLRVEDWEKCKQRVARSVEVHGCSPADISQGRLRLVADNVQRALHLCLQGLRDTIASLPGNS